jgi:peptidyl-tRNA hydrolase
MEPLDSSEAAAKRANQEDPIVMYLIVRESLGMGIGKTAAQCAHASQMLQLKYDTFRSENEANNLCGWEPEHDPSLVTSFKAWLDESFRKVVLKADDKEWDKIKAEFPNKFVLVVDAGLTEIAPMSETVIGLWPMKKSQVPKVIKKLQVLK